MKLELDGTLQNFAGAAYGDVLVAHIGGLFVRVIKAYYQGASEQIAQFVTVGPFTDDDDGAPGIYDPSVLKGGRVLNVTGKCLFHVSCNPDDLLHDLPVQRQCCGLPLIGRDGIFLGAKSFRRTGIWEIVFLNLVSGEIAKDAPHYTDVLASKHWSLVRPLGNGHHEILHDFAWIAKESGGLR